MLNVGAAPIHLYVPPTDMRKSFRGLCALVHAHLGRPENGAYYVFVNRRKTHVKILYWDRDGLAIWYKRLSRGQFLLPRSADGKIRLSRRDLALLLEGVTPRRQARRFNLENI